jgi:hypothetical protein
MNEAEDEAERLEQALKAERQRLREIGQEADTVGEEINPPKPQIDHANDGGVI